MTEEESWLPKDRDPDRIYRMPYKKQPSEFEELNERPSGFQFQFKRPADQPPSGPPGGGGPPWARKHQPQQGQAQPPGQPPTPPPGQVPPPPPGYNPAAYPGAAHGTWGAPSRPPVRVDRAPTWMRAAAVLVVLAVIAGGIYLVTNGGKKHPKNWDGRVADLAVFVEKTRGHQFDHPVKVNFLTPAEYTKASTGSDGEDAAAEEDLASADDIAEMRALGFIEGTFDMKAAGDVLVDSGSLAFYSWETQEVYVRGTEMTPGLKVTLVHELTHVLQDQKFDLTRIETAEDSSAQTLRDLAEGDATRIEDEYIGTFSEKEIAAYEKEMSQGYDDVKTKLDEKVPQILQAVFQAPYVFGPLAVRAVADRHGNDGVDKLFENPPSEFAIFNPMDLDPSTHPAKDQKVLEVPLPDGAKTITDDSFAPVAWYLMLASRIDPKEALAATDTVTADGYRSYKKNDRVCVDAKAQSSDVGKLTDALQKWSADAPGHDTKISDDGDIVTFQTCDPGEEAKGPGTVTADVLVIPATRAQAFVEVLESGAPEKASRCFANAVVDEFTIEEMQVPPPAKVDAIAEKCG